MQKWPHPDHRSYDCVTVHGKGDLVGKDFKWEDFIAEDQEMAKDNPGESIVTIPL